MNFILYLKYVIIHFPQYLEHQQEITNHFSDLDLGMTDILNDPLYLWVLLS